MSLKPMVNRTPNQIKYSDKCEENSFNHTVNDYDIRPPRNELQLYEERCFNQRLVIDSCARNKCKYPNNAMYTVDLEKEYNFVKSIELVQAIIPFSGYAITEHNNLLYFQETYDEIIKIIIPCGNYTPEELAQLIEDEMNRIGESNYTVTILKQNKKFKFTSDWSGGDHIFKLLFEGEVKENKQEMTKENTYRCNSIGEILGFVPFDLYYIMGKAYVKDCSDKVYGEGTKFLKTVMVGDKIRLGSDDTPYTVQDILSDTVLVISPNKDGSSNCVDIVVNSFVSEHVYDLEPTKYIALFINNDTTESLDKICSNNNNIQDAFAIIPNFLPNNDGIVYFNRASSPNINNIYHYYPTNRSLNKLTIKFTDKNGNLYDFNGREHVLEFNIQTVNNIGN